ncbi:MAG: TrbC/VirB2 family protein [Selenomonadaceae bacterium]|nr:TrbC/VirB2 family protein [Selenomonadaceae bacterium]
MKMESFKNKAKKFLQENRWTLLRITLAVAAVAIFPDSVSYAQSGTTDDTISVLTQPLSRMESLMSGPVPKAIVTIGAATGAASWALNIENQITKTAMRVVGGGSVALGAATFVSQTTGFLIP